MKKPSASSAEIITPAVQDWLWNISWEESWDLGLAETEVGGERVLLFLFALHVKQNLPNCVLPFRMGYAYNGPTSVMSSRTKYHGGEGDIKTANPSKQFDKNAYVWRALLHAVSWVCYKGEPFTRWSHRISPIINTQTIVKVQIFEVVDCMDVNVLT